MNLRFKIKWKNYIWVSETLKEGSSFIYKTKTFILWLKFEKNHYQTFITMNTNVTRGVIMPIIMYMAGHQILENQTVVGKLFDCLSKN